MNYKLKKDTPPLKAKDNIIFEPWQDEWYAHYDSETIYHKDDVENNTEWFEPISERIELALKKVYYHNSDRIRVDLNRKDGKDITTEQKDLMQKAVNNELIDIDSIDDADFKEWYFSENTDIGFYYNGIKAVLKAYFEQRK